MLVERSRAAGITREETKTDAERRTVDLRNGAIQAQKAHTALENDLVFHDPQFAAGWHDSNKVARRWNQALRKAGVRQRALYQTRHTFASTLLSTGLNALYVAKQMGHKDTTMVTKTYGNWIEQEGGVLTDFYVRTAPLKLAAE